MSYYSSYCGLSYQYYDDATAYGAGSWNEFVEGSNTYRVTITSIWCGPPYVFGRMDGNVKKNGSTIADIWWEDGTYSDQNIDNGHICVAFTYEDCVYEYVELDIWWGKICTTYSTIYVHSTTGDDTECGDDTNYPVKTFNRAYSQLNSGGIIHVKNNGADFSGETVTYNKSFRVDLNGSTGSFKLPHG